MAKGPPASGQDSDASPESDRTASDWAGESVGVCGGRLAPAAAAADGLQRRTLGLGGLGALLLLASRGVSLCGRGLAGRRRVLAGERGLESFHQVDDLRARLL